MPDPMAASLAAELDSTALGTVLPVACPSAIEDPTPTLRSRPMKSCSPGVDGIVCSFG